MLMMYFRLLNKNRMPTAKPPLQVKSFCEPQFPKCSENTSSLAQGACNVSKMRTKFQQYCTNRGMDCSLRYKLITIIKVISSNKQIEYKTLFQDPPQATFLWALTTRVNMY